MGKPEIRFKGYTDEWEQRKLGEVTQCLDSERVPINSEERKKIPGEIPYYGAGNIQGYINKFLFDEELVLLLEDGDAFDDFRTKEIAQYICGKTWVNNHAHVLRPLGDAYFLYITLSHKDIRNWVQLAGASRKKLVQKSMLNIELFMPHIIEQKKIGQYFSNLDHLITLHQRKCDEIKSLKKYMLQKMFPQNEQKVPEIRFEGFTEAWEQRKVSEIAIEKLSNGIMNNQSDDETGVKHINVINMYDTDKIHSEKLTFSNYDEEAVKKCNVEFGDIFLTRSSLKPEGIAEANVLLDSGRFVYDDHLIRLKVNKEKYDPFFVKLNLSGNAFKRQFIVRAKTTAFTTIGQEDISECLGFFPKKEEQQQIGEYFMILDHLITLHQQKCEELKKIKKFMLQKMFV